MTLWYFTMDHEGLVLLNYYTGGAASLRIKSYQPIYLYKPKYPWGTYGTWGRSVIVSSFTDAFHRRPHCRVCIMLIVRTWRHLLCCLLVAKCTRMCAQLWRHKCYCFSLILWCNENNSWFLFVWIFKLIKNVNGWILAWKLIISSTW